MEVEVAMPAISANVGSMEFEILFDSRSEVSVISEKFLWVCERRIKRCACFSSKNVSVAVAVDAKPQSVRKEAEEEEEKHNVFVILNLNKGIIVRYDWFFFRKQDVFEFWKKNDFRVSD